MAEPEVKVEGDSEAAVALVLLQLIMKSEPDPSRCDRDWILSTYADCLAVVNGAEVEYEDEEEDGEEEAREG
ncbi:hypothetical protein HVPorG_01447 [Roseomonas mucosa]|uniref:Uncharacterized protein n=2 Tax=Roseomonas TaxID=125216 RepID=A0A1S8D0L8_9PROT|nr:MULTISPECIES: hypothetical protein [Roseomonas]MBS5902625.1 hypothetical protein [Acetobacteraceae bacterium]GAV32682.1 hypothetical protein ROTAS13_00318 [Roseomonas sp. TAS13]ATR21513.1 hypothetical protein CTJ15_15180 [Roseomonas sp. FDAARGOS_362]AWV21858.1 hypothetical protein RADP37_01447 [Roseomonas mucosa]MCG7351282.1 hypothetical protein [Roseomonas mucosa]